MLGQHDRALTEYTEALRLKPDLPTAHLNIAVLQIKDGRGSPTRGSTSRRRSPSIPGYEPARQLLARLAGGGA